MAINRTAYDALVNDTGAGTDGTIVNKALIASVLLDPIDAAIAAVPAATATKLDDLTAPDDNTDLNASITKHGLLPKLSNVATQFLNGVGGWAVPAGAVGPTAWTPADGSGAGLTFSAASGYFVKVGPLIAAFFDVQYPTTSNTAAARISGLPYTSYGFVAPGTVLVSLTNYSSSGLTGYLGNGQSIWDWYNTAGGALQNVALTGRYFRGVCIYITNP